jgi:hypothetical protein
MFFVRRNRRGPDPHLGLKTTAFTIGAALALAGMVFELGWLITAAIVLLAATLIGARVARARRSNGDDLGGEESPGA